MNFFKTSTLVPPVIWWSFETKTFRWDVQQRGRGLQPLGFFRFPNLEVFHVAAKHVFLGSSQNISGFVSFATAKKSTFWKRIFWGPKVWVAIFGLLYLPCLNLWTYQHILPQIFLIQVIVVARSTDTCARLTELTCKCLMCAGYLATCSKFGVPGPARPLKMHVPPKTGVLPRMLEGSPIQLSSSIQPPIALALLAPVALPGRSTRDTGPKKQFRRPRRFFPLMSPPWSVLRRHYIYPKRVFS